MHIFYFADSVRVLAFAQAGGAEVEAQHRESETVERFHGMKDNFVVQRSTVEGMRMADDGSVRRILRSGVEQSFQASGGTGEKQGADAGEFSCHEIRVQQSAAVQPSGALVSPPGTGQGTSPH
jgi:hypothetical protein